MRVPGSNILKKALRVLGQQKVAYFQNTGRTLGADGKFTPIFAKPITVAGSLQSVPRAAYQAQGLDFNKRYKNFFTPQHITDVGRGTAGDRILYDGRLYQVESSTDWTAQDGWNELLCVDIGPATDASYDLGSWGFDAFHENFYTGNFFPS